MCKGTSLVHAIIQLYFNYDVRSTDISEYNKTEEMLLHTFFFSFCINVSVYLFIINQDEIISNQRPVSSVNGFICHKVNVFVMYVQRMG